jgi:chromosome segregation ATPase
LAIVLSCAVRKLDLARRKRMKQSAWVAAMVGIMLVGGSGCSNTSSTERTAKREQDRLAMQLADAQRERDSFKTQLDSARKTAADATTRQQAAESQLEVSRNELNTAKKELAGSQGAVASIPTLNAELKAAQEQLAESKIRIEALQQRLSQLEAAANAPTTKPMMDQNR